MTVNITPIPIFSDNYVWTITRTGTSSAVVIDPGDAKPVSKYLDERGLNLEAILITHHHWDHVGGIDLLKQQYGATVYGPVREKIEHVDVHVSEGDTVNIPSLELEFSVLDLPGHTTGHVGYLAEGHLFCGDTLFSAGCGRLFNGTAEQLHTSLNRISALPDTTAVCCTHEYTLNNLHFAQEVEPDNVQVAAYIPQVEDMMRLRRPSLPSSIAKEKQINPFLRTTRETVRKAVSEHTGRLIGDDLDCFTELRKWKDNF